MSELSKALGNESPGHKFECNGKTYHVKLIDQSVKVGYEKVMYKYAKDAVTSLRHDMDSDQYVAMLTGLTEAYEAGDFSMEGKRGIKAITSPRGSILLLSLLLGVNETEVISVATQKQDELAVLLQTVIKESFPGAVFEKAPDESDDAPKA